MSRELDQEVSVAKLLFIGGLVKSPSAGTYAISRGAVYIERWNIGIGEAHLPRWVLRGVTITCGDKTMTISDDGFKILRDRDRQLHA